MELARLALKSASAPKDGGGERISERRAFDLEPCDRRDMRDEPGADDPEVPWSRRLRGRFMPDRRRQG